MNRSLGILFVIAVAVSMIGYSGSPASAPAAHPEGGSTADASSGANLSVALAPERCKLESDLSCPNCGSFCPAQPLRDTITDFFPAQNAAPVVEDHLGVPQNFSCSVKSIVAIVPDPAH